MKRILAALALCSIIAGCSGEPESVDELKKAGQKAYVAQDYALARQYLRKALEKSPSDKDILYFTGLAYRRDYLLDSALFFLKRADFLYPKDRELNQEIYEVAAAAGDWKYAKDALRVLIETGDPESKYYEALTDIWTNLGSPYNAFYYLVRQYREVGFERAGQFMQLASIGAQIDSTEVAQAVLDSAITRFGDNDDFQLVQAKIYFQRKQLTRAETLLRRLTAAHPDKAEIKMNLANALANMDSKAKKREAIEVYRQIQATVANPAPIDSLIAIVEEQLDE